MPSLFPNLITSVQTTASTTSDSSVTANVHDELNQRELVPSEHLLDTTYGSTDLLLESRCEYEIELICPMRPDNSWQARTEGGFDISQFVIEKCRLRLHFLGKPESYLSTGQG